MKTFFSTILPSQGIYFIITIIKGHVRHYPCKTVAEMNRLAIQFDGQGYDVYFACASFKQESYIGDDGKSHQRTGDNAGWVKSFFLDIDCGPDKAEAGKGYETINDALAALRAFIIAVGLPMPIVIFSGGGLHVYWPLTEAITKEQWHPVAKQLKALTHCPAIRLIADDARTSDIASILRPIGTHNYKPERNGAVVTQRINGEPTNFDLFSEITSKAHQTHCGSITRRSSVIQLGTVLPPDPETPENIARLKSALGALNPDCDRDLWRDICFAVHSTGWTCSEELARNWSKGDFL